MTQENKELLLKDLCARLPYGVKCIDDYAQIEGKLSQIGTNYDMCLLSDEYGRSTWAMVSHCKPYLYPFSSMTEEQEREYLNTCNGYCTYYWTEETFDWLNAHHFDYRGLIDEGLAIDCTNLNIY